MPIYVYECLECKSEVEEIQKMSDPPLEDCPKCGKKKVLEKKMGKSNFQLKGGGWADDGYSS